MFWNHWTAEVAFAGVSPVLTQNPARETIILACLYMTNSVGLCVNVADGLDVDTELIQRVRKSSA